ncbi:hypothetical protein [Paraclostridium sordellii]|uniref:hypothetical protein n=1 Tax=Paraclostridium sordellii TaxID=1505 RepID=UPI0022DFF33D|nr:hypothetical protein [Paeniclostridium sordellii]
MKINELMLRDIRAEINFNDEVIVVRNAKGEARKKILKIIDDKLMKRNDDEVDLTDLELIEVLLRELTNIEIEDEDMVQLILLNPCDELNRVIFYLASILQELAFESLASKNLQMRAQENLIVETDTLHSINRVNTMVEEMKQRAYLKEIKKDTDNTPKGEVNGENI